MTVQTTVLNGTFNDFQNEGNFVQKSDEIFD